MAMVTGNVQNETIKKFSHGEIIQA